MTPLQTVILVAAGMVALLGAMTAWRRRRAGSRLRLWTVPADDDTPIDEVADWYRFQHAEHKRLDIPDDDWIGDTTWRDLEGDALFRAVDFTDTPLGRQQLYAALRAPATDDERRAIDALARACEARPDLRDALRRALSVHHASGGYRMHELLRDREFVPPWAAFAPLIALVLVACLLAALWVPRMLLVAIPFAAIGIIVRLVGLRDLGVFIGPMRELAPLLTAARRAAEVVEQLPLDPTHRESLLAVLQPRNVPLRRLARITRIVRPDFGVSDEVMGSVYEYINLVLLLDVNALYLTGQTLRRHRAALGHLFEAVGRCDVGCSIAALRATRVWCTPQFAPHDTSLRLIGLQHPTLRDGVANDICLERGTGLLLTGANMSGKSTLLRAIGSNIILGRALATCTAQEAILPVTNVFTSIGHSDDLARGVSYFYAEAQAVAELLHRAEAGAAVFLFDELFRGTNAAERIAAAEAVLRRITRGDDRHHLTQWVALASHDLQLGDLLQDCFSVAHLAVRTDGNALDFRYQLQDGPATTRTALALLAQCGVDSELLATAAQRAESLERRSPS